MNDKQLAQIKAHPTFADIRPLLKEVERLQHDLKATQSRFETMAILSTDRGVQNEEDKEEIERLKLIETALRNLYNDCRNEPCDEQRGIVIDNARKALEQE